jgi:hypothetical protein
LGPFVAPAAGGRYRPVDPTPSVEWTGDTKDHPGYGPASAATEATEHAEAEHAIDPTAATPAVEGSAEPTSPAAEFCAAEIDVEKSVGSDDPGAITVALEALVDAAPNEIRASVEALVASLETGGADLDAAYAAVIDYVRANCGYAELDVATSEYSFSGLPAEVAAGPTIIDMDNLGEQIHELVILRIDDASTLTGKQILALPEEQLRSTTTYVASAFAFPATTGHTVADLTPGRYLAMCTLPEGATPEAFEQLIAAEGPPPEGSNPADGGLGAPHFTHGMFQEFNVH